MTDHTIVVSCPTCGAEAGKPCTRVFDTGRARAPHANRVAASPEGRARIRLESVAAASDRGSLIEAALAYAESLMQPRAVYMVHANPAGSVFVKTLLFFASQGGFHQRWGRAWTPVVASDLEDARREGCRILPLARPYERQAVVALRAVEISETPG